MKKIFLLAATVLVAFTACTKIEDTDATPARKITFQAASYLQQTKAEVSIMSEFTSFQCKAFLHAAGYTDETQLMFGAAETISAYNSSNAVTTTSSEVIYWAPSHDYYWPKDATSYINFVAWYDKKGTAPAEATETSLKWNNYEVLTTDNLLFADEAWRYKANPTTGYHLDGSVSEGVPMLFHHALAQLCIQAKVTKATDEKTPAHTWDVTLLDITLDGVYNKGTLALTNSDKTTTGTKAWTGSWSPIAPTTTVGMSDVTTPLTTTAVNVLSMQNVLPQTVTDAVVLNFKYNISYKYNGTEYAHEKITAAIQLNSITDAISSWDMNKQITYTITINPETTVIRIDPAMVDWEAVAGGSTTI